MDEPGPEIVVIDGVHFRVTPRGLMALPQERCPRRKHACPSCRACLWCPESKCALCREDRAGEPRPR